MNSAATTDIIEVLKLTFTACLAFGTARRRSSRSRWARSARRTPTRFGWASVRLGLVIFGVVGLCEGVLFTRPIIAFITQSEAVRAAALFPLHIVGLVTPIIAVGMILSEALFGAGNSKFVALAQLALVFGCLLPLALLFGVVLHLALVGIGWPRPCISCLPPSRWRSNSDRGTGSLSSSDLAPPTKSDSAPGRVRARAWQQRGHAAHRRWLELW